MGRFVPCTLISAGALFAGVFPRVQNNVNRDWTFQYFPAQQPEVAPASPHYNDASWPAVGLPHTWSTYETTGDVHPFVKAAAEHDDSYWWYGWGWYRKRIEIDASYCGRLITLVARPNLWPPNTPRGAGQKTSPASFTYRVELMAVTMCNILTTTLASRWVDAYRNPKYMYYLCEENYGPKPMIFIELRNWRDAYLGQKKNITVDSNCYSVTLPGAPVGTAPKALANSVPAGRNGIATVTADIRSTSHTGRISITVEAPRLQHGRIALTAVSPPKDDVPGISQPTLPDTRRLLVTRPQSTDYAKASRNFITERNAGIDTRADEFRSMVSHPALILERTHGHLVADDRNFQVRRFNSARNK